MLASIHADFCACNPSFARFSEDMGLCESVEPAPEPFEPAPFISFEDILSMIAEFNVWAAERECVQVFPEYVEQLNLF